MNERIRELADQASEGTRTKYEWRAKFAELIVRECIMLQYRRGVEGFGILEERMLKEHFGFKE